MSFVYKDIIKYDSIFSILVINATMVIYNSVRIRIMLKTLLGMWDPNKHEGAFLNFVSIPFVLLMMAALEMPGSFTAVMCVAKYSEKRVSINSRSPMESAAGVTSASVSNAGALPEPHPATTPVITKARLAEASAKPAAFRFCWVFLISFLPVFRRWARIAVEGCGGRQ